MSMVLTSLALSLAILWNVLFSPWYPMHDSTHPMRLALMQDTISSGQFPPIWASGINSGYGYPLFHFYAPLYHYTSYFFSLFLANDLALKLSLVFFTVLGLSGIYQLTKRWGRPAALLSVTSVALSPYLALDLYVRGAYAEYVSLCLFPWVIFTLSRLTTPRRAVVAALATAAFLLSHNLIPILSAPLIALYLLYLRPPLKTLFVYGSLTLILSAWFIGPLVFERHFTQAESIAKTTAYQLHFVEPWQIWNSTWGFGGSAPGVEDGMSFKLGKLQLLLALLSTLIAISRRNVKVILLSLSLGFTLFLSTPYSLWLWENLPLLPLVQFPWRSLGLSVVLAGLLAGYALTLVRLPLLKTFLALILCAGLLQLNLKYFAPQTELAYPTEFVDIARVVPEYLPRWMPAFPANPSEDGAVAYYPTWKATQNGQLLNTSPDARGILTYQTNSSDQVTLTQSHTTLERLSYALTVLGAILTLYLLKVLK